MTHTTRTDRSTCTHEQLGRPALRTTGTTSAEALPALREATQRPPAEDGPPPGPCQPRGHAGARAPPGGVGLGASVARVGRARDAHARLQDPPRSQLPELGSELLKGQSAQLAKAEKVCEQKKKCARETRSDPTLGGVTPPWWIGLFLNFCALTNVALGPP